MCTYTRTLQRLKQPPPQQPQQQQQQPGVWFTNVAFPLVVFRAEPTWEGCPPLQRATTALVADARAAVDHGGPGYGAPPPFRQGGHCEWRSTENQKTATRTGKGGEYATHYTAKFRKTPNPQAAALVYYPLTDDEGGELAGNRSSSSNNNTIGEAPFLTGEEPPPHSGELNHALPQAGGPTQTQLSRPMSSGHHISMEHRLWRKQLNSDTNASNKTYLKEIQEKTKTLFLRKKRKKEKEQKQR